MKGVDRLMHQALADGVFPGAVLLVSRDNRLEFFEAYGCADVFSGSPVTKDTIFDLASLTKPLGTTLAVMHLIQESRLKLDQKAISLLPRFADPLMAQVTVRHLLAHCSGLRDYHPYYLNLREFAIQERKERLEAQLAQERLVSLPGSRVLYSDIGFMILRWMVETISGDRLDHFLTKAVFHLLGLKHLFFIDPEQQPLNDDIAATEFCAWRSCLLKGKVHDENAYTTSGVDGHAGLFGSAADIAGLISILLSDFRGLSERLIFDSSLIRTFWSRQGPSGRALGFDMPLIEGASCGRFFPKTSVGHLGYTGTSFWIDPENMIFVVLLTNRVHPSRYNVKIRQFRPRIHDEIMENLLVSI